jgi:hypothetical protein
MSANEFDMEVMRRLVALERRLGITEVKEKGLVGSHPNRIRFMAAKNIPDNTATSVIRITTTNEAGSNDGGGYSVLVHCLAQDGLKTGTHAASRSCLALFARAIEYIAVGVTSPVVTLGTTVSADAIDPAQRTITTLTVSTVEVDEYNVDIQVLIDHSGTLSNAYLYAVVCIDLLWYTFATPPTVAAV